MDPMAIPPGTPTLGFSRLPQSLRASLAFTKGEK